MRDWKTIAGYVSFGCLVVALLLAANIARGAEPPMVSVQTPGVNVVVPWWRAGVPVPPNAVIVERPIIRPLVIAPSTSPNVIVRPRAYVRPWRRAWMF